MSMTPEHHHHEEETPVVRDPEGGSGPRWVRGDQVVAVVVIVLAILVFLALYVIPALT